MFFGKHNMNVHSKSVYLFIDEYRFVRAEMKQSMFAFLKRYLHPRAENLKLNPVYRELPPENNSGPDSKYEDDYLSGIALHIELKENLVLKN